MKTAYHLNIKKVLTDNPIVSRCVLEQPEHKQHGNSRKFRKTGLEFRGWMLMHDDIVKQSQAPAEVYLKGKNQPQSQAQRFVLEVKRRDVIQHFYAGSIAEHPQVHCGFQFNTTFEDDHLELGFIVADNWIPAFEVIVQSVLTVLKGDDNWLFLDNDTNGSVAQHTGEVRLNRQQRKAWTQYMKNVQSLAGQQMIRYCLLVAPAKEAVFADKHPLPRAAETVMDDMLAAVPHGFELLYPIVPLRNMKERSFRVTDTHWTSPGAAEASLLAVETMGLDVSEARALMAQDTYKLKRVNGDLGIKIFPPKSQPEKVLTNYNYKNYVVYDNGLPNFGRVVVIRNTEAIYAKRCLIFGSSSAYSMLAYLSRVFSELVLIHCAGNVDENVVAEVRPDCLLLQTNARFVIRAPACSYVLENDIASKLTRLSKAEVETLSAQASDYAETVGLDWVAPLHARLLRALP